MFIGHNPIYQSDPKNAPSRLKDKVLFRIVFINAGLSLLVSPFFAFAQDKIGRGIVVVILGLLVSLLISGLIGIVLDIFYLITKRPKNWLQ